VVTEVTKPGNGAAVVSPDGEGVVYEPDEGFMGVDCEYACVIFARCGGASKKIAYDAAAFLLFELAIAIGSNTSNNA